MSLFILVAALVVVFITWASAPAVTAMLVIFVASMHVMVRPKNSRQPIKTRPLRIAETLIERHAGIGDALKGGAGLAHVIGPAR